MKKSIYIAFLAMLTATILSCGDQTKNAVSSQGAAYEVFVVCSSEKWDAALGDTLRAIMLQSVEMINEKEPMFDVLRIQPQAFDGLVTKHRNILMIKTGAEFTEPSITAQYDVYAEPQIIVTASAQTDSLITAYMWEHKDELQQIFESAERDRTLAFNDKYGSDHIEKQIKEQFGFDINIPKGYTIRNTKEDFLWISNEFPQASQGVVIYSYPYTGKQDFTAAQLTSHRNQFTSMIPGPADSSYMVTADIFEPVVEYVRIDGRFWAIIRGFWDVKGDYMGGPFVCYSTLDTKTNRVIAIDCYLYSPKHNKRNMLRALQTLIYSVKFPDQGQQAAAEK